MKLKIWYRSDIVFQAVNISLSNTVLWLLWIRFIKLTELFKIYILLEFWMCIIPFFPLPTPQIYPAEARARVTVGEDDGIQRDTRLRVWTDGGRVW